MKLSSFGYDLRDMIFKIFSCKRRGLDFVGASENKVILIADGIEYTLTITQKKADE